MESKKINQLATELAPDLSDLTIIGDPTTGISKKITLSQMASLFTGTVEEYANLAAFPLVGVADTIYIAKDTNVIYRWDSTAYVVLSPNIIASLVFNDANGFDGTIALVGSVATLTITTALTSGSVPFIGASGALTQDNSNLFFDDTNNRLGIATASPTTPLDVFGSGIIGRLNATSTNNSFLGFASNGTNKWSAGNVQSDHRFRIFSEANSAELITILQTGEFGIGIANPTTKFHIDGAASALIANLDANVSIAKSVSFRSDNSARINLEVSGTESGSNVGADFFLRTFTDAGSLIETPLSIVRSTGVTTIKSLTLTNVLSVANGGTGSATQNFVDLTTTQSIGGAKTFTSALAATSATFSGNVTSDDLILTAGTLFGTGNTGFSNRLSDTTLYLQMPASAFIITDNALNTKFILSSAGAATFSSAAGITNGNGLNLRAGGNSASDANVLNFTSLAGTINVSMFSDASSSNTRLKSLGNLSFHTGNIAISADNERITITSAGNVGINTSSPLNVLDVRAASATMGNYQTIQAFSTDSAAINLGGGISLGGYFTGTTSIAQFGSIVGRKENSTSGNYDGYLAFGTNAQATGVVERMRITSGGNVLIADTTSTNYRLIIATPDTGSSNFGIGCFNSSGQTLIRVRNDGAFFTGTAANSPYNLTNSGRTAILSSDGVLGYLVSTRESKANIKSIENVDYLNKLNPVCFNYRKKDLDNNTYTDELNENTTYGFIADEVEKVNKDLVFYNEDGSLAGVEYNNMIAILTKAVQELKAEIDILKAK